MLCCPASSPPFGRFWRIGLTMRRSAFSIFCKKRASKSSSLPNQTAKLGQPLAADCELGKSIENLAARIASDAATGRTAPTLDK